MNYHDHTKEDKEIKNKIKLQGNKDASLPDLTSLVSILTIKEILDTKKNGEKVSLIAYLAAENRPVSKHDRKSLVPLLTKKKLLLMITLVWGKLL